MAISQVGLITVYTLNQDEALAYYRDKLGFELIQDAGDESYRWVEVAPPGGQTGIVLAMPQSDGERALIGQQGCIFFCDNVQQTYDELAAYGVSFHAPPATEFWGTYAQFKDHQGNEFLLSQRSGLRSE